MSGFAVVNSPPVAAGPLITNDGWFPDVDPGDFIGTRLRDSITPQQRRDALIGAIITVGNDLDAWAATQRASGYAALADVPATKIDGKSRLLLLYTRAVFSTAKADLIEGYRDVDLTGDGQRKMEEIAPASGELRREALYAIRDILKVGRVTVELI